ncbi:MAG: Hsp70 family protein [Deltaproteobacteria bacterium]|nr:Hsp70 family protein [Deltaproteobacteria bacterium]MBW2153549.1 Hsp70 family protein [Deltaproteobacteria bacterium]
MDDRELIVGIDLGTTNSEIAGFTDGRVQIIGFGNNNMLPSCVGISSTGELLIGAAAKNQLLLYPDRTVRSIKRKMGTDETVSLGDKTFTPQEISALLLRELVEWVRMKVGFSVKKAVISVPAYFSDAQRNATREAGELAGLEVVRIINEPTAASLAYGYGSDERRTIMVYDLGGGTFDVSIVTIEQDVTEVLASHGNNRLGGDDFDQLLVDRLLAEFRDTHGIDLNNGFRPAVCRLWQAAEEAKKTLSAAPFATIREEALVQTDGKQLHLESEISRESFEELLQPLIESTLDSVSKAMNDAGTKSADLDAILLVGGSTRIPLISRLLEERTGISPHHEIHPDLCVALGAGVLASRLSGHEVNRVLVDITPYSFGPSYIGERGGLPYAYCYHPVISANTPVPVTRTEKYYTSYPFQKEVAIDIYQGEDPDALKNIPVGHFRVKGLRPTEEPSVVLVKMSLDVDGILKVTAIEKATGKSKQITIENALSSKSDKEIEALRKRLQTIYATRSRESEDLFGGLDSGQATEPFAVDDFPVNDETAAIDIQITETPSGEENDPAWIQAEKQAQTLLSRSRNLLSRMHDEDREEAINLHEQIESALTSRDVGILTASSEALSELLFFVEGK